MQTLHVYIASQNKWKSIEYMDLRINCLWVIVKQVFPFAEECLNSVGG